MQRKIKSLVRRSLGKEDGIPQSADQQSAKESRSEHRSSTSAIRTQPPRPSHGDTPNGNSNGGHHGSTRTRRASYSGGSVTVAHSRSQLEDVDRSVADNYRAYLPVLSRGDTSGDSRYPIREADSRRAPVAREKRHSENVADRNMDRFGTSPQQDSFLGQQKSQKSKAHSGPTASNRPRKGSVKQIPVRSIATEEKPHRVDSGSMDFQHAGTYGQHNDGSKPRFIQDGEGGRIDLRDTEDVDKTTHWAPAVTHEIVKPTHHEIIEERVFREIHNHDVYHYVQPVYELEILPARHFVNGTNGALVEVTEEQLSQYTGWNRNWYIAEQEKPPTEASTEFLTFTEPRIIKDETHVTPEGFERRETTILHPPELEDMSDYKGMVMPIEFFHHEQAKEANEATPKNSHNNISDTQPFSLTELNKALPSVPPHARNPASFPAPRAIPRKPLIR